MTRETRELLTCELCFAKSADVIVRLAWYRDGGAESIQAVDRCANTAACRDRVQARGDRWPLVDRPDELALPNPRSRTPAEVKA